MIPFCFVRRTTEVKVEAPTVDERVAGTYIFKYACANSKGLSAVSISRTIIVYDAAEENNSVTYGRGQLSVKKKTQQVAAKPPKQQAKSGETVTCLCAGERCGSENTGFASFGDLRQVEKGDLADFETGGWSCGDESHTVTETAEGGADNVGGNEYVAKPQITILNSKVYAGGAIYLTSQRAQQYEDPGALCNDQNYGDLTSRMKVEIPKKLRHGIAGKYSIRYTCTNEDDEKGIATRDVVVETARADRKPVKQVAKSGITVACTCAAERCGSTSTGFASLGDHRTVEKEDLVAFRSGHWSCKGDEAKKKAPFCGKEKIEKCKQFALWGQACERCIHQYISPQCPHYGGFMSTLCWCQTCGTDPETVFEMAIKNSEKSDDEAKADEIAEREAEDKLDGKNQLGTAIENFFTTEHDEANKEVPAGNVDEAIGLDDDNDTAARPTHSLTRDTGSTSDVSAQWMSSMQSRLHLPANALLALKRKIVSMEQDLGRAMRTGELSQLGKILQNARLPTPQPPSLPTPQPPSLPTAVVDVDPNACLSFQSILDRSDQELRDDNNPFCKLLEEKAAEVCSDLAHGGHACTQTCLARMDAQQSVCAARQKCPTLWR